MANKKTNSRRRPGGQRPVERRLRAPSKPPAQNVGSTAAPAEPGSGTERAPVQMQLGGATAKVAAGATAAAAGATVAATATTASATSAQRRAATQRRPRTRPSRGIQIGDQNPAIPLDRVPYFTADLIRLAITAAIMILLLVLGAKLVIPRLTG